MAGTLASRQMFAQFQGLRVSTTAGSAQHCSLRAPLLAPQRRCRLAVQARQHEVGVGMFGTKAGMTQIFVDDGLSALPATIIALEPGNIVAQVKTRDTDGYNSVQVRTRAAPAALCRRAVPACRHCPRGGQGTACVAGSEIKSERTHTVSEHAMS